MLDKIPLKRLAGAAFRNTHPSLAALWTKDILHGKYQPKTTTEHLRSTMNWLKTAHEAGGNQGVAGGFSVIDGWLAPYPETTGYIIETFYDYAAFSNETDWSARAAAMADWEIAVQMPNGAVQAGLYKGPDAAQVPAVFNTGQVILGWCRAFRETNNADYREAAERAGEWLIGVQADDGAWRFESQETETDVHAYDVRTAWSLLEIFGLTKDDRFAEAACRNLEWTLSQQHSNGWFENNAFFTSSEKWTNPFTHTIAYVMEGFQESYRILGDRQYFDAYAKTAEKLLRIYELKKFMAGDFDEKWKSSSKYSCLTGNAQIAGVWLRHYQTTGDVRFLNAALKLNDDTKSAQNTDAFHDGIRGGVKGSSPINGRYTPYILPNWAAKFFADTLMLEERLMTDFERRVLNGEKLC